MIEGGKVLVIGIGGLGSPAALTLARAGVGLVGLADGDRVDLTNLHRQLLHTLEDIGQGKVTSAAHKLERFDPPPPLRLHPEHVTEENASTMLSDYDFVIDATDGAATKFLLNDAAVALRKPLCHAGVVGLRGQIMTILPGTSACLRCVFPSDSRVEEPTCRQAGILGPIAGILGALQAHEALRYFAGSQGLLTDRLVTLDFRSFRVRELSVRRAPECSVCGPNATTPETRAAGVGPSNLEENR